MSKIISVLKKIHKLLVKDLPSPNKFIRIIYISFSIYMIITVSISLNVTFSLVFCLILIVVFIYYSMYWINLTPFGKQYRQYKLKQEMRMERQISRELDEEELEVEQRQKRQ